MPGKNSIKLLLTENVDNLGIVGDVVNVKIGYARNYLLPRDYATEPSQELIDSLAAKRAEAEKQVAALRKDREEAISKIDGLELTLTRSCNDQGMLYGSVTQHDIAEALTSLGFPVKDREVRLPHAIKRIDSYEVTVKLDADLEGAVKVWVVADRKMDDDDGDEMEFDNEGNLIEKKAKPAEAEEAKAETAEA